MRFVVGLLLMLIAAPVRAQEGTWKPVPDMEAARYASTATTLADGRVLVAGGYDGSSTVTSAQLFDPFTETWSSTGSLLQARHFATATRLDDGKVLVAGGFNVPSGSLGSAELYDPATGMFTLLDSAMQARRGLFTATKLSNGKVLLVGGYRTGFRGGTLRSAEIYDPERRSFTPTGSMVTPYGRFGHAAILLSSTGKVLIVGGKERRSYSDWRSLDTAEIYDPFTGKFTTVPNLMAHRRDRPALAAVAGKVLVIGGKSEAPGTIPYDPLPTEWFDLTRGRFTTDPAPLLNLGRMAHTVTELRDGSVLAVGGWAEALGRTTETAEHLVPDAGAPGGWKFVWAGSTAADGTLPMMADSRHDHAAALLRFGRVLIVGGKKVEGTTTWLPRAEIYTP